MIAEILGWVNSVSQGNQMIAGAVTLALSGAVGAFVMQAPKRIVGFLKAQFTTTVTFNNTSYEKRRTFVNISKFLHSLTTELGTRSLMIDSIYDWDTGRPKMVLTLGRGNHFFIYRKRLMMLSRIDLPSSGGDLQKEEITITVLGRKHKIFSDLVDDNTPTDTDDIIISDFSSDGWRTAGRIPRASLSDLALDKNIKDFFSAEMKFFKDNKELYYHLGLPYKSTFVLHGKPGSGKTSIIRSLAGEYQMNICRLSLGAMSDTQLLSAFSSLPVNSIVLMEDFDSARSTMTRSGVTNKTKSSTDAAVGEAPSPKAESKANTISEDPSSLASEAMADLMGSFNTLSGILNTLDGVSSLDGVVIFMTTNCIEKIDPAILRPGRVDHIVELPAPSTQAIQDHFVEKYPSIMDYNPEFTQIEACHINRIKNMAKGDSKKAAEIVTKYTRGEYDW